MVRPTLIPFLLLFLIPTAHAKYTLVAEADHESWDVDDGVERYAVRLGNCMGWVLRVTEDEVPVQGAAVSVTDGDGRRSLVYTSSDGTVRVGTRTCHTIEHVADHAFEVTGRFGGGEASSNRVVHEVMWSAAQVYADAPAEASGSVSIPIEVVWTATNEAVDVATALVTYGNAQKTVALKDGRGVATITVDGSSTLTVSVPAPQWPNGGQDASIAVRSAGPYVIRLPDGMSSSQTSSATSSTSSNDSMSSSSTSPSAGGGGGGGGGGGVGGSTAPGIGTPPPAAQPVRQAFPDPATVTDRTEGPWTPHPAGSSAEDGRIPGIGTPLVLLAIGLAMIRRRVA